MTPCDFRRTRQYSSNLLFEVKKIMIKNQLIKFKSVLVYLPNRFP